jgi:hypothetical protein
MSEPLPLATGTAGLPECRGPLTEALFGLLAGRPSDADPARRDSLLTQARALCADVDDPLYDDDFQLALTVLYELHYRGIRDVDERWEWDPDLLAVRALLEGPFEVALRALTAPLPEQVPPADVPARLFAMTAPDGRPGLASYMARTATREQWLEFALHRSAYQLKEADPHTWAIPRLSGRAKAALAEVQFDEYGGGQPERIHSYLYVRLLRALSLDDTYGAALDRLPAITLAWVNSMSLFGLHRRLRGAAVGHLTAYEMTSALPCHQYAKGLRRLGYGPEATDFFDEHIEADAVHEQIAGRDLAGGLAEAEPDQVGAILFGAATSLAFDELLGKHLLGCWQAGESSLRVDASTGPPALVAS